MNDMILNMLANDSFTVSDFKAVGLTADNTKLESEDKYKNSQMIQENDLFKDNDGNFSEELFHQYYLQATQFYNNLANETYLEDISKNTVYSKDNLFAPQGSQTFDETPKFVISPNPFLQSNSLTRVGKKGDRTMSVAEIAQTQKVYDYKDLKFKNESVNDRAMGNNPFKWLEDLFSEPLVIAQWDDDGEHLDLITGEIKKHKKGDYKYNEDGTFYYETLGGRDVYGKLVLNRLDTLTVDGSAANAYDFFDSDDLQQKKVIGSVMKNMALVGSMFLPVVGPYVALASVATQSVGLLGALGKMALGSDSEISNTMHAWAKTVNRQNVSEYASQNTWCWENLINMIGDTVGQLKEQRALFTHVPALFKGTKGLKGQNLQTYKKLEEDLAKEISELTGGKLSAAIEKLRAGDHVSWANAMQEASELQLQHATMAKIKAAAQLEKYMEGYNQLGSILSKTYMTGITVLDTYGEAKANGASDMEALALTLGYAAGEAAILNTGLGKWIMPELQGEKLKYRGMIDAIKKQVKPLSENAKNTATKEAKQNWFKQIFNVGKKLVKDDYARQLFINQTYQPMSVVLAHAGGEAFEELSEEVLSDISKTAFNTVNWLRGDETRVSGAWESVGDRYLMSALGGFIGGGITSVGTDFSRALQLANMTSETAMLEIVYMINNDKIDDFLKFANKATISYKNLSFDTDENGNFKAGTKENNQDKEIKDMLNMQVLLIKDTINAEGAKFSENSLFDALTLKDLRYLQLRNTRTACLMFLEYNSLVTQMWKLSDEISKLSGDYTDTDTKKKELSPSEAGLLAEKRKQLNELRVQKDAITSGKRAPEFIASAMYEASPVLHGHKRGYTFDGYIRSVTNKSREELSESDIEKYKKEYIAYRDTEMKNDVLGDARLFVDLVGMASGAIQESLEYLDKMLVEGKNNALKVLTSLGSMLTLINASYDPEDATFDPELFIADTLTKLDAELESSESSAVTPFISDEYLQRLYYIENTETDAVYTDEIKQKDKLSVILEAFADYTDTITLLFIELGYIHPEVKNHLLNTYQHAINTLTDIKKKEATYGNESNYDVLEKLSAYADKDRDELEEFTLDGIRYAQLEEYITHLKSKLAAIESLSHTPVVLLLEGFKTATSTSDLSVKDVLDRAYKLINEGYYDISDILFGVEFGQQLDEVDEIIDVYASALYATRVDKSGVKNSWGYSKTLNELNKKYGNDAWVLLAEIEGEKADLILQDLALIKQKIQFAKNLSSLNSGLKLNAHTKVGINLHYIFFNKFKRLADYLERDSSGLDTSMILEAMNRVQLLKDYNHVERGKRRLTLTPDEKVKIEEESLILNDALYDFFNSERNSKLLTDADALADIIGAANFNLFDPCNKLLTDQTEDLDDRQFIFSLAARAALKGSVFYDTLRKTFNEEKAPVPIQEQAVYLNTAMVFNGDVMNHFAKAYAKSVFKQFSEIADKDERKRRLESMGYTEAELDRYAENPDLFKLDQVVDKFANIVLTEGIAGSGKSRGVFDSTKRVIQQLNPDLLNNVFYVHSTLKNAENSLEELELTGKAFSTKNSEKDDHDLIRHFYSDFTDDYKDKVNVSHGELTHTFTLKKDLTDLPKIIFLDEASRYDYVKMKLLSEAALHYGIVVLAAGDFDQISAKSSIKVGENTWDLSPNRLNFIGGAKFGLSFRSLNTQQSKNQKEVLANLYDPNKLDFNMYYWEDEKEIRGFKVYNDPSFDEVVASVEKIKKLLKPEEKIGFLYADKNKSLLNKLKEKFGDIFDDKTIDDAQGLEGRYYIIDINQDGIDITDKTEQQLRNEFYTAFTRSEVGGLILSSNRVAQPIKVTNVKMDVSELEKISPESIKATSKKRKEIFDKIFDGVSTEIPPYKPITRTEITSTIETSEETPETEGLLPPPPPPPPVPSSTIPEGMYKTREEAERIDTSAYRPGLELLDKDDNLVGVVEGTSIQEHTDSGGITYYYPAVNIKKRDGSIVAIGLKALEGHKLKDPTVTALIPKYKVDDVFYDGDAKALRIKTVEVGDSISYILSTEEGSEITVSEADLDRYSTTPPVLDVEEDEKDSLEDLGEHEDPETYERRVRHENASNEKPEVTSDGRISHWLYTFNGYETGVLFDESGRIKPEYFTLKDDVTDDPVAKRSKVRIDNVNGLIKLGAVNTDTKKERCLEILADIHAILMSDTDNASVINRINEYTADNDIVHIEYGIKSSAGISSSDSTKVYGTGDSDEDWHVFDKHIDEKSEYAHKHVVKGDALNRTSVVAVFRNSKGEKVLEITLGSINSPITIGQRLNESGEYIYPEVGQRLEELDKLGRTPTGEEIYLACRECRDICLEKGYTDLYHLFKAFLFTSNGYAPISKPGSNFNLALKRKTGPNIIGQKGNYQKDDTRLYTPRYVNLSELQKDERVKISRVWIPKSNTYGAKTYAHIKPGHAGVFVTYNTDYSEDDLALIYLDNLEKGTPSDVEFYYVIPPDATTAEYLTNFRNGYLNAKDRSTKPTFAIGNMWTAYKLLRNIKNGGEFTLEKLKSKILDLVDFDVVDGYLQKLMDIENRTDWDGDARYETLYEYYKRYYTNSEMAKQQAIRRVVLEKLQDILMSKNSTTNLPIYKLFLYYIANAAYWSSTDTTPNPEVVKLIEKYNKGTIKYKILYQKDSGDDVGIFAPARTSDSNGFAIKTIDEFGNVVEKEFMINEKIDPPIFEFEELKEAITTLADYEYDERTRIKKLGDKLRGETEVYRRDTLPSRGAARPKNNFEKLKDSNKILFRTGGLFKDITVENADDPDKSSELFAIEILEKFNSTPNNLGFAVKDSSGKIKMYAFKIDELDSEIARPEMETLKSLGGITIGKALMFNTESGNTFEVESDNRKYYIHIEGNHIVIQPTKLESESRSTPTIKVSYNATTLTPELVNESLRIINESDNEALKASFSVFDWEQANANPEYALSFDVMLKVATSMGTAITLPEQFVNFLAGASGLANVVVGDTVSLSEDFTGEVLTVDSVNGSLITLSDSSIVDLNLQDLFKKDKDTLIDCIQPIKIKYGK